MVNRAVGLGRGATRDRGGRRRSDRGDRNRRLVLRRGRPVRAAARSGRVARGAWARARLGVDAVPPRRRRHPCGGVRAAPSGGAEPRGRDSVRRDRLRGIRTSASRRADRRPRAGSGWLCWLALDGDEPASAAGMYVAEGAGYLGFAATLPEHRGKGAQSALLAERIRRAARARLRRRRHRDRRAAGRPARRTPTATSCGAGSRRSSSRPTGSGRTRVGHSRSRRVVDRVRLEVGERDELERGRVRRLEHHRRGDARLERLLPA